MDAATSAAAAARAARAKAGGLGDLMAAKGEGSPLSLAAAAVLAAADFWPPFGRARTRAPPGRPRKRRLRPPRRWLRARAAPSPVRSLADALGGAGNDSIKSRYDPLAGLGELEPPKFAAKKGGGTGAGAGSAADDRLLAPPARRPHRRREI